MEKCEEMSKTWNIPIINDTIDTQVPEFLADIRVCEIIPPDEADETHQLRRLQRLLVPQDIL